MRLDDQYYHLTCIGFGLALALNIMSAIFTHVLPADPHIVAATNHYVNDIIVDMMKVTIQEVVEQLNKYGLLTKVLEALGQASVLSLKLIDDGQGASLCWGCGKLLPQVSEAGVSHKELFSICGKLVRHHLMVGWLRVACSYLKYCAEGHCWKDMIDSCVIMWLESVLQRV